MSSQRTPSSSPMVLRSISLTKIENATPLILCQQWSSQLNSFNRHPMPGERIRLQSLMASLFTSVRYVQTRSIVPRSTAGIIENTFPRKAYSTTLVTRSNNLCYPQITS